MSPYQKGVHRPFLSHTNGDTVSAWNWETNSFDTFRKLEWHSVTTPLPDRTRVGTVWKSLDGRLIATLDDGRGVELPLEV